VPELPEVETTRSGLAPHLVGTVIKDVVIRNAKLRWPIPKNLPALLRGRTILSLKRRAKYLLMNCGNGVVILHLGMSGSLRITPASTTPEKHDHFDLVLENGNLMRMKDPRRFGAVLWEEGDVYAHKLLASLGPEPLEENFNADHLFHVTRGRKISIKQCIMDNHVVVGVGNIYANEALFRANIKPQLAAGKLSRIRCKKLVMEIRSTLQEAINLGGSTLRDYVNATGQTGYFQQTYWVYGRTDKPCHKCGNLIKKISQGQRSSFYCKVCQK